MQSSSSSTTPAGYRSSVSAEEREAAANNPPRRKRRRIATGHGVQQIPETSVVLLPPQQQEQLTLRPVEQRHVAEHQAAATASFTGAEPAETGRPKSAAAFVKAPAADEPMAIETSPARKFPLRLSSLISCPNIRKRYGNA